MLVSNLRPVVVSKMTVIEPEMQVTLNPEKFKFTEKWVTYARPLPE